MNDLVPVYHQIKEAIKGWIASGIFGPEAKIPSEAELTREFGVSRLTVRQAIARLVQEGFLVSRRGMGTFVTADQELMRGLTEKLCGSIEDLFYHEQTLKTVLARITLVKASPVIKSKLALPPDEGRVVQVVRLRSLDGTPIVVTRSYLKVEYRPLLSEDNLLKRLIWNVLEDEAGISIRRVQQSIEASFADQGVAGLLNIPSGSPILVVERVMQGLRRRPVFLSLSWYRADIFRYVENFRIVKRAGRTHLIREGFRADQTAGPGAGCRTD